MAATASSPMARRRRPSLDEFRAFVARRVPLVIEGALDEWSAQKRWTFDRLKAAAGGATVRVQARYGRGAGEFEYRDVPFDRFIESARSGTSADYLAGCPLLDLAPELWSDVGVPPYVGRMTAAPLAFIGPPGAVSPLHFDRAHSLSAQLVGRKKVIVLAFRRSDVLRYPELRQPARVIEPFDVEIPQAMGRGGLTAQRRWECTLEAGDLLYLPWRRHHFLRALDETISLSFFWHTLTASVTEGALAVLRRFAGRESPATGRYG